ncbi:MAG: Undecaprenyl-phosphate 4-deoxy-4-formamido-L-arabinose transferase [candidate division BRC1 bacterium ADurb.BinA364]|nr:MAG: Undecaprenyl-phosphate 4-deoxy-4-formamido-L-arabinose transferase [candidate division BRC1 bacterium ADurb.BinA364]
MTEIRPLPFLSVILPAYDEAENIGATLARAHATLAPLFERFEIIVVDDGSEDATPQKAIEAIGQAPEARLLRHEGRRGYGAALKTGIREARGEWIFFTDADGQFDFADFPALLEWIDRYDIVAGYRSPRRDPPGRALLAWGWALLARWILGLRFRDINCAFKLFHRRVFDSVPIESVGAFVNTEILVRARKAGFTWRQVPVSHYPRRHGRQTGARPRTLILAWKELWRFRRSWR